MAPPFSPPNVASVSVTLGTCSNANANRTNGCFGCSYAAASGMVGPAATERWWVALYVEPDLGSAESRYDLLVTEQPNSVPEPGRRHGRLLDR